MGYVVIQKEHTTIDPISLIGKEAGICWGTPVDNAERNYKRGLDCIEANHGRTLEFPQIYMELNGYSARVIREFYTHVGGLSTRIQASTRYIDYKNFDYITPHSIEENAIAKCEYNEAMKSISSALKKLEELEIPKEDLAMLLPLGMSTRVICRMNLRTLLDMTATRLCTRAYWEFRQLIKDIWGQLAEVSQEWRWLMDNYMKPKCELAGYCTETYCCGRMPKKDEVISNETKE